MDAAAFAAGLREFADWIEANEETFAWEIKHHSDGYSLSFGIPASDREEFQRYVRALGRGAKAVDDDFFTVERRFGPVKAYTYINREKVCTRKVVGTRLVTKTVRDPERVAAIPLVEITETVEDVEWVCEPSVLAPADEAVA